MAKDEWFRRTTWTDQDSADFQMRLARSRGASSKAQYLRIQAFHLYEVRNFEAALKLIDQLLHEVPEISELDQTYLQQAKCYAALGNEEAAIQSFRKSLAAQASFPNSRSNVALDFAWYIAVHQIDCLYVEVEQLLEHYQKSVGLTFPIQYFMVAATRALVADAETKYEDAYKFAQQAKEITKKRNSGLRYHPTLGLVEVIPQEVALRLSNIETRQFNSK